jgi:hypothetical protein
MAYLVIIRQQTSCSDDSGRRARRKYECQDWLCRHKAYFCGKDLAAVIAELDDPNFGEGPFD